MKEFGCDKNILSKNQVLIALWCFIIYMLLTVQLKASEHDVEEASEYERILMIPASEKRGIIEAKKCQFCPVRIFLYDEFSRFENINGDVLMDATSTINGNPATITWKSGSSKARRVIIYHD